MFLCVSLNIREEERETLIQNEVGKRLTISLPIFLRHFFLPHMILLNRLLSKNENRFLKMIG